LRDPRKAAIAYASLVRLLLCALLAASCRASSPDEVEEKFPKQPVEIVIDDSGVPHIYAKDDGDLFYAAGYQMASDRLYQMEMLRRRAYGRLAEVLGEDGFPLDRAVRTFDLPKLGRADHVLMKRDEPERARLLRAWTRGINARIEEVRSGKVARPFGFRPTEKDFLPEPWDEADPYVVLKGAGLALDKTIEFEIAITMLEGTYPDVMKAVQLLRPAVPFYTMPEAERPKTTKSVVSYPGYGIGLSGEDFRAAVRALSTMHAALPFGGGSNNWAVDGRHTKNGKPLIAGDPHLSFEFFGAPYPMHLSSPGYDVAGFAYPGTPGIALGHNAKVIWTATSAFADVTDVWAVKRKDLGVVIGDEVVNTVERTETIKVRGGREEEITYEEVPGYGVLIPQSVLPFPIGGPFLVNWPGLTARPARWFLELNRVSSIDEFEAAVDRMREMNYNFVAADSKGIAYRVGMDTPVRRDPSRAPYRALDGSDATTYWPGPFLPREQLPRTRAKDRGWIATANNDPFGFTADGRVDNDPWYYGALFDPGFRAKRIEEELTRLATRGQITLDDIKGIQLDTHSGLADELLPLLEKAHGKIATDDALAEFRDKPALEALHKILMSWDRRMARDSAGALAFLAYQRFFTSETMQEQIKLAYDFAMNLEAIFVTKVALQAARGDFPDASRLFKGGVDATLLRSAMRTVGWIEKRFGSIDKLGAYRDVKVTRFDHAFGYGVPLFDTPSDGGEDTVNVSQNIKFDETQKIWPSDYVSVKRTLGTFGDDGVPEVWVTFPVGNESDPNSALTKQLNTDYVDGKHRRLWFKRADVDAHAAKRTTLGP
jgi:penicillin G amidase